MADVKSAGLLLFCTAGIYGAYLTQGLVSEHLQMKRYGASQERFGNLEALNGAQSLMCFLWAYVLVALQRRTGRGVKAAEGDAALPSWWEYWRPALTNAIGPAFGMVALKNISYPVGCATQMAAQSTLPAGPGGDTMSAPRAAAHAPSLK
jgi:UDP-galactose transporter B1